MDKQNEINFKDMTDTEFKKALSVAGIAKELDDFFEKTPIELEYNHPNGEVEVLPDDFYKVINDITRQAIIPFVSEVLFELGYRKIPENAVVLTQEEWATVHEQFAQAMYQKEVNTRKETAEKFAQALENRLDCIDTILHEDNEEEYLSANELGELIDEICKEITERK